MAAWPVANLIALKIGPLNASLIVVVVVVITAIGVGSVATLRKLESSIVHVDNIVALGLVCRRAFSHK